MFAEGFDTVLLSHAHSDHMSGLPHIQGQRTMVAPDGPPMKVYSAEESVQRVQSLFRAISITHSVHQDGVTTSDGSGRHGLASGVRWRDGGLFRGYQVQRKSSRSVAWG